ncbi:RidA family protein [Devosia oryziradicis]|uniref:RidA family protein n=1 Tax=Devosia oryziradicis TaxID=2801335 RepID=A0ABX7BXJ5_9HYPH|nr:RidA family protein [Devosia oryziradicis]QQR34541.1 RidA family protein [Devosia oryziradicis]
MAIEHLNPQGMYQSPIFSQGIVLPANSRILLIGGQNGVNAKGAVVAKGDVAKQTEQALSNLQQVLKAAGAGLEDLVKVTIVMQQDIDLNAAFGAWMAVWGKRTNPPTVSAFRVPNLSNPDFLIEIEAMAALA